MFFCAVLLGILSLFWARASGQGDPNVIEAGGAIITSILVEQQFDTIRNSRNNTFTISAPIAVTAVTIKGTSGDSAQYQFTGDSGFSGNGDEYYFDMGQPTYRFFLTNEAWVPKEGGIVTTTTYELYDTLEPQVKETLAQIGLNEPPVPSSGAGKRRRRSAIQSETQVEITGDIHRRHIEELASHSEAIVEARRRRRGVVPEGERRREIVAKVVTVGDAKQSEVPVGSFKKVKNAKRDFRLAFVDLVTGMEVDRNDPEVLSLHEEMERIQKMHLEERDSASAFSTRRSQTSELKGDGPAPASKDKLERRRRSSLTYQTPDTSSDGSTSTGSGYGGVTSDNGVGCSSTSSGTSISGSCSVETANLIVPSSYSDSASTSALAASQISADSALTDINSVISIIGTQMGLVQDQIGILAQAQAESQYQFNSILTLVGQQAASTGLLNIQNDFLASSITQLGATVNANFNAMATTISGVTQLVGAQVNALQNQMYALQTRMQSVIDGVIVEVYSDMANQYVQLQNVISDLKIDNDMREAQLIDNINQILKQIQVQQEVTQEQVQQDKLLLKSVINSLTDLFQHNFGVGDLATIYFAHKDAVVASGYLPITRDDGIPPQNMSMYTVRDGSTLTFSAFECTSINQQDLVDANTLALEVVNTVLEAHAVFSLTIPLSIHPDYLLSIGNLLGTRTDSYNYPFFFITVYLITAQTNTTQTLTPAVLSTTSGDAYETSGVSYMSVNAYPTTQITDAKALEFFVVNTQIQGDTSGVVRDGDVFQIRTFIYTTVYTLCPNYNVSGLAAGQYTLRLEANVPLDNVTCQWWIRNIEYANPTIESQYYLTQQPFNHDSTIAFIPYTGPSAQNVATPPESFIGNVRFLTSQTGILGTLGAAEYSIYRTPPSGAERSLNGSTEITYEELTVIEATRTRKRRSVEGDDQAAPASPHITRRLRRSNEPPQGPEMSHGERRPGEFTKKQVVDLATGKSRVPKPSPPARSTRARRMNPPESRKAQPQGPDVQGSPASKRGRSPTAAPTSAPRGTMGSCFGGFIRNTENFALSGFSGVQNSGVPGQDALLTQCIAQPGCTYAQITEPRTINVYAGNSFAGMPTNLGAITGPVNFTGDWQSAVIPGSMTLEMIPELNYHCLVLGGGSCVYHFPLEYLYSGPGFDYGGGAKCQNAQCYCRKADSSCVGGAQYGGRDMLDLDGMGRLVNILVNTCDYPGAQVRPGTVNYTSTAEDFAYSQDVDSVNNGVCCGNLWQHASPWTSTTFPSLNRDGSLIGNEYECNVNDRGFVQSTFCSNGNPPTNGDDTGAPTASVPDASIWKSSVVRSSTCQVCSPGMMPNNAITDPATASYDDAWCIPNPSNPSTPTTVGGDVGSVTQYVPPYVVAGSFPVLYLLTFTGDLNGPGYYSGCLPTSAVTSGGQLFPDGTYPMPLPMTTPYIFEAGDAGPSGFTFQGSSTTFVTSFAACSTLAFQACLSNSTGNTNIVASSKYQGLCYWGVDPNPLGTSSSFSPSFKCGLSSDNPCASRQASIDTCISANFTNSAGEVVALCLWDTTREAGNNCQPYIGGANLDITDTYPSSTGSPDTTVVYIPCYYRQVQSGNTFPCTFDFRCYALTSTSGAVAQCLPLKSIAPLRVAVWSVPTRAAALAIFNQIMFGNATGSASGINSPSNFASQCLADYSCVVDGSVPSLASSPLNIRLNHLLNMLSPGAISCSSLPISNGACTSTILEQAYNLSASAYEYPADSIASQCEVFATGCQYKCALYGSDLNQCLNGGSNCMIDGQQLTCLSNTLTNTAAICPGYTSSTFELGSRCVGTVNLCTLLRANQTLTGAASTNLTAQSSECSQLANFETGNLALNSTRFQLANVTLPVQLENACLVVQQYGNLSCQPQNLNPGCSLSEHATFCNKDANPFLAIQNALTSEYCLYPTLGECLGSSGTEVCSWIVSPSGYSRCTTASSGANMQLLYGTRLTVYTSASYAAANRVVAALYESSLDNLQSLYGAQYSNLNISQGSSANVDPTNQVVLLGPPTIPCSGGPLGGDPSLDTPMGYMCCVVGDCTKAWRIYPNTYHPKIAYIQALQSPAIAPLCQGVETAYNTSVDTACKIVTISGTPSYVCEPFAGPNTGGQLFFNLARDTSGRPDQEVVLTTTTPPRMLTPLFTDPVTSVNGSTWRQFTYNRYIQFNGTQYNFDLIYNITMDSLSQPGAPIFSDVNVTTNQVRIASTGNILFSSTVLAANDVEPVIDADLNLFISTITIFTGSKIQNAGVREDSGVLRTFIPSTTSPVSGRAATKGESITMAYTSPGTEVPIYLITGQQPSFTATMQQSNGSVIISTTTPVKVEVSNPYENLLPRAGQQYLVYEDDSYLYALGDAYIGIGVEGENKVGYIYSDGQEALFDPVAFINANQGWFDPSKASTFPSQYRVPRVPCPDKTSPCYWCGNTLQGTGQAGTNTVNVNVSVPAQLINVQAILAFYGTIATTSNITAPQQAFWTSALATYGLDAVEFFLQTAQAVWTGSGCTQTLVNFVPTNEPLYDIMRVLWMGAVNLTTYPNGTGSISIDQESLTRIISPIALSANRIQCGNCVFKFDSSGNPLSSNNVPGICDPVYGTEPPVAYQPVKTLDAIMTTVLPFCTLSSYYEINWQPDLGYVDFTLRPGFGVITAVYRIEGDITLLTTTNGVNLCPIPIANGTGDIIASAFRIVMTNPYTTTILYTIRVRDYEEELVSPYNSTLAPYRSACNVDYLQSMAPLETRDVSVPICSGTFYIIIVAQDGEACPSSYFTGGLNYVALLRNSSQNILTIIQEYNSTLIQSIQNVIEQSLLVSQSVQALQSTISTISLQIQQNAFQTNVSLVDLLSQADDLYTRINNQSNVIFALNTSLNQGVNTAFQTYNLSLTQFQQNQGEVNQYLNLTSQGIQAALGTINGQLQTIGQISNIAANISNLQANITALQFNITNLIGASESQAAAAQAAAASAILNADPVVYAQGPVGQSYRNTTLNIYIIVGIIGAFSLTAFFLALYLVVKECTKKK